MLAVKVIDGYSHVLESVVAVAFFIPVLMATGGNIGTQSLALTVRGMATEELSQKNILPFLLGETLAGLQLGIICGTVIAILAYIWQKCSIKCSRGSINGNRINDFCLNRCFSALDLSSFKH